MINVSSKCYERMHEICSNAGRNAPDGFLQFFFNVTINNIFFGSSPALVKSNHHQNRHRNYAAIANPAIK